MATTIQVQESTRQMLDKIKQRGSWNSFDDVIVDLAREKLKVPKSLFGKGKGKVSSFKREDRLKFREI